MLSSFYWSVADQSASYLPNEAKPRCETTLHEDPWTFSSPNHRFEPRQKMLSQVQDERRRQLFKIPRVGRTAESDDNELTISNVPSSSSSSSLPKQSSPSSFHPISFFRRSSSSSLLSPYPLPASQFEPFSDYLARSRSSPSSPCSDSSLSEDEMEMISLSGTRSQRNIQVKIPRVGRSQRKTEEEATLV